MWQAPAPEIRERNTGLAWFHIARENNLAPEYQRAFAILSTQPHAKDPEVSAALGYMLLGSGHAKDSISLFQAAVDCQPYNSEYWLDLGVAQQTNGNAQHAISSLSRAIDLAPYDYRSYKALSDLYRRSNQAELADKVLARFLSLVPQSLTVRLMQ
jgi:tetratricopeptide (TPR) repeat protein